VVNDWQVRRLMKELHEGDAGARGAEERDEREHGQAVSGRAPTKAARVPRTYRTRPDPFEGLWPEVEKMLEAAPGLESKTIFGLLLERPEAEIAATSRGLRWNGVRLSVPQPVTTIPTATIAENLSNHAD
jgi:hypothetical protein